MGCVPRTMEQTLSRAELGNLCACTGGRITEPPPMNCQKTIVVIGRQARYIPIDGFYYLT